MITRKDNIISLVGEWRFALDESSEGIEKEWYNTVLHDRIRLPGSTDENKKGFKNPDRETKHLTREYTYCGYAWYQRDIDIPERWRDMRIFFLMERTKTSRVWLDEIDIGAQDSNCAPHLYYLGNLEPGRHVLTVMVDNAVKIPLNGHQLSEDTQTNWNGMLGRIELFACPPVMLEDVQVYPDVINKKARVKCVVSNFSSIIAHCTVNIGAESFNIPKTHKTDRVVKGFDVSPGVATETWVELRMGEEVLLWDEFSPAFYSLSIMLESSCNDNKWRDEVFTNFGMREFRANGTQFAVNGKTVFLRGKHDACVFPLTGYSPMDVDSWERILRIAKSYGINHYRFHTWFPPEAAFEAADRVGIYMQPELWPGKFFWDSDHPDYDPEMLKYLKAEAARIMKAFGNHPSFVMFALGNELGGSRKAMAEVVDWLRSIDSRHLYAQGSNNFWTKPMLAEGDDYWTTFRTNVGSASIRGAFSHYNIYGPLGHIQIEVPSTNTDYSDCIKGIPVPVISHEVGQYQVYPDYDEIAKYIGVLKPRNLEIFRDILAEKGMAGLDKAFHKATGALAVMCYREEIEAALRTAKFGGFQLLDLQDYPGQGTALVGILDAFMDSKGLIEPDKWREFCSEVVLLFRMEKYVWTTDETVSGLLQIANYGPDAIKGVDVKWILSDSSGNQVAKGMIPDINVPQGGLFSIGEIDILLKGIKVPQQLELEISLERTNVRNSYPLWVYPSDTRVENSEGLLVCERIDDKVIEILENGGRVLVVTDEIALEHSVGGFFTPDFWCYTMFRRGSLSENRPVAPGTLGLLCDPEHPALADFPTEFHSNWQWWRIVMNSRSVILDEVSEETKPIVQVVDNIARCHRLGLIFEGMVGKGRLLFCTAKLLNLTEYPEAQQLLNSLIKYAKSQKFCPVNKLDINWLAGLF